MNKARTLKLIKRAIETFQLELSGLTVLTEAASGYYMLTPMIAAIAGADNVVALTKKSRFGKANKIQQDTENLAQKWNIAERIQVIQSKQDKCIETADIITNLGFLRPLDAPFIKRLKDTAVIPLMWETWEFRPEDLDLDACRRKGIAVLGTNEHHKDLNIFEYIGPLTLKLLFRLDIEIHASVIVVIGSGEFAEIAERFLKLNGAAAVRLNPANHDCMRSQKTFSMLKEADAVVVIEHHNNRELIGNQGEINVQQLHQLNPGIAVAHVCGNVDREVLATAGVTCCPERFAPFGYMSVATDFVGPRPLIDLHTAGLRVGEVLARLRLKGMPAFEAEMKAIGSNLLVQGFTGYHSEESHEN